MVGGRKVFTWGATEGVGLLRSLGLAAEKDCWAWFAKAHFFFNHGDTAAQRVRLVRFAKAHFFVHG